MKALAAFFYVCVAGVVVSFGGSLYTGYRVHQEKNTPQPSVFPTPATGDAGAPQSGAAPAVVQPVAPGSLPTPAG